MATFALIHGGGSSGWDWHRVVPLLEQAGHRAIAVDLPTEDATAELTDYVRTVTDAVGAHEHEHEHGHENEHESVIVVGHSLGGFTAPLAVEALHADGLVYFSAMIPMPDEEFMSWWTNTGHDRESIDDDPAIAFYNGVPPDLVAESHRHERGQDGVWLSKPWPGERHPPVPTLGIVCTDDRFFPAPFMRRVIRERLGSEPVEMPGGHYAALTHPKELAAILDVFAREIATA